MSIFFIFSSITFGSVETSEAEVDFFIIEIAGW